MKNKIRLGLLGAGRIGQTHANAITHVAGAQLVAVADPVTEAVAAITDKTQARAVSPEEVFDDPAIDGVILATPTDLHADQIERAAVAGKAIFCEKPIDLNINRACEAVSAAEQAGVALMLGFNRRYDPSFARMITEIRQGRIGAVELVQITSRDPAPPPLSYIAKSGGLFRDMMIHDFDLARCLMGEEFIAVNATGSALVDEAIGTAGDVDTASATLRTASGRICTITNSRRAVYGYDQRIEVHGSYGMLSAGNPLATTVSCGTKKRVYLRSVIRFLHGSLCGLPIAVKSRLFVPWYPANRLCIRRAGTVLLPWHWPMPHINPCYPVALSAFAEP